MRMISELYGRFNYISGLKSLFSTYIREYDIAKANISILYTKGVISKELYEQLLVAHREERQITIGLMQQKDSKIVKILQQGIFEAKKALFELNQIQDADILTIKNDAVFVINRKLQHTQVSEYVEFKLKNTFMDFLNLKGIEFYYGFDRVAGTESIDVKGLGKKAYLHEPFMTDFIAYILNSIETGDVEDAISSFQEFFKDYTEGNLDIGYYREYNSESMYPIMNTRYKVMYADNDRDTKTKVINGRYNIDILREIFSMLSSRYFLKIKF